jgi:hypothetical protein
MTLESQTVPDKPQDNIESPIDRATKTEKILCPHCRRTATNGIKCKGICVADSDY